ncbi:MULTISPECIES: hypothetical protein [Streptosporangium]|uniref:Uncharacterized protein n=1 Tax=Streptosporangium brasiliense TaxID=47480 RepID=A0ABT9RIN4_9ACTN|nr:hypothetical protein [Streptosporangium brasiliense]MDP9868210.1 hypothetical protein [Streptosporangium brasiliense]
MPRKARDADRGELAEVFTADDHARGPAGRLDFTAAGTFWTHDFWTHGARPEDAVAALSAFRL